LRQDIRLGRVAGIPVGANWSVAVVLLLIAGLLGASYLPSASPGQPAALYWLAAAAGAVLFLASLLAHELSHAAVARRNGVQIRSITLWMLGGVAELDADPPDAGADLRIALVGPATSATAAGLFLGLAAVLHAAGGPAVAVAAAGWLAVINGILAVFNMLPGAPLDGGRVLRAMLWRHYRDRRRAESAAARSGQVVGAGIVAAGLAEVVGWRSFGGLWLLLVGWFLISAASAERAAAVAAAALRGLRVADVMTDDPELGPAWSTVQDFIVRTAARSDQDAFPVVDLSGGLAGLVLTDQLAGIPLDDRPLLRLDQVANAVPAAYLAAPDDPAGPLLGRRPLGGQVVAVVLADGRVTGLVTMDSLRRAARWNRLAATGS
jgi:Zn-dependent protease/CBS domain-containing protein